MSVGTQMAAEVAKIRPQIASLIGCSICAMGIAIDAVGARYGYASFEDWRCHNVDCPIRARGVPAEKLPAINEVIASLPTAGDAVAPSGHQSADTRLPPEREDASGNVPF